MAGYPISMNEAARSRAVERLALMRRQDDPFFAAATAQARAIFGTPISFISLFEGDRQSFLARENIPFDGTPRDQSLCSYTVAARRTVILHDTHLDPRSRDHPIVTREPHVRFSASAPVLLSNGFCVGTVCAIDLVPHDPPSEAQVAQLESVAAMISRFYEVPHEPDADLAAELRASAATAQDQFLSLVGHELRTPLNGILGLSQILEPADEDQGDLIEALQASADRLGHVVEHVIAFSELRAGELALNEGEVDLPALLTQLAGEFRAIAAVEGKAIEIAPTAPCRIRGDETQIGLALACLLSNVVAHGGTGARLSAEIDADGRTSIIVGDDGPGIAPDAAAKVWDPFVVGEDSHTRRRDGIGLGLPLTRRVVEMHGGEIDCVTGADGLQVAIRLPAWRSIGAEAPLARTG